MKSIWQSAAALAMVLGCASAATATSIVNGSFEQPITASFIYDPIDPTGGWTFFARSGVAANTFLMPPPPDGNQAAFIQQFGDQSGTLSAISQSLSGVALVPSVLRFFIAQRPGGFSANPITVFYGAQNLGTFTPASTAFAQVTINFTPTVTSGALSFRSATTTTGDLDTALDVVSFSATTDSPSVPEPTTLVLIGTGTGLLARRRLSPRGKHAAS